MNYFEQKKQLKHEQFISLQNSFFHAMDNFFEVPLFQDYLQEIHGEDYTGLDDDMPDAFDEWYCDLSNEERMNHFTNFITK